MSIDPRFPPPADDPAYLESTRSSSVTYAPVGERARTIPHIGHTLLFGAFVLLASALVGIAFALTTMHLKHYVHETAEQMQTDPRIVIPVEAVVYAVAAGASLLIFPLLWRRPFAQGVRWRAAVVQQRWWLLAGIGIITSITVQILSNFLPIPKELPIDKFFTNRIGVWLVAIFGVTVAPACEELAFRGFLLPSLASAWDWVMRWGSARHAHSSAPPDAWQAAADAYADDRVVPTPSPYDAASVAVDEAGSAAQPEPQWSMPALVFSTIITSIGFALLHSGQLAHSLAPLSVLFAVSVVLCITRLRFHSLAASTVVHSMYNATIFLMLFISTDGFRHLDKVGK